MLNKFESVLNYFGMYAVFVYFWTVLILPVLILRRLHLSYIFHVTNVSNQFLDSANKAFEIIKILGNREITMYHVNIRAFWAFSIR